MKSRLRSLSQGLLLAGLIGGAGFAVARAEPAETAPQYVKFEPVIVPVFIDNRSAGLLSVRLYLEADDSKARARIEAQRPRLIDAYTNQLIRHARLHIDPSAPIDVPALTEALTRATAPVIAGEQARVLILEAMAQPA